jgi:uncharacterized membrane protein
MDTQSLEARVARLERMVEELHRAAVAPAPARSVQDPESRAGTQAASVEPVERVERVPAGTAGAGALPVTAPTRRVEMAAWAASTGWRERIWDSEFWLDKLGVGLLLFGVTFLFKYSVDQGWLTPLVRVGFGATVGAVLLLAGLRLGERQRALAQVLLGGGIATFYVVGFAAFQLYELVGYGTAFAFMVAVTVAAFSLAVRDDHPLLSLIGVKGALGTPFLLYQSAGDFTWLVGYTSLVVASGVALCIHRGWRSVLWTALVGGWAVLGIAYVTGIADLPAEVTGERWILQGAVLFCWLAFAVVVPAWELTRGALSPAFSARAQPRHLDLHLYLLVVYTPLLALGFTGLIWSMAADRWGWLTLGAAAAYIGAAVALRPRSATLSSAHWLAAALLLPSGTVATASGDWVYFWLAVQAATMHLVARRLAVPAVSVVAHAVFAACALWFLVRLDNSGVAGSWRAGTDLLVIAAAALASTQLRARLAVPIYLFAVHAAVLAWLWRELAPLPAGAALVSTAWGAYGLILLVVSLRQQLDLLQRTAIATLLLMVGKLFVVDLAALEAIWRILLFLGLGGVFLTISYLLRGLWEGRRPAVDR